MATGMFSGVPSPNRSVLGAKQLQRPADPYLRQQYPEVYGALGGFMGMAPDEMSGSIFDPNTARVRAGAEYGFPVGTVLQVAPLAPMLATGAKATARALGPTAVGMGERYLQSRGLMPAVVEGESIGMLGGPIKPQAPVSPIGFYSATEQAALNLPRKSGTGESFLNDLMKGQDVKKDELSWLGLDDYLKGKPNVTRQEVQDFISSNRVDVREVKLGGNEAPSQDLLSWMSARSILPPRNPEGWQELSQKLERYAQQHQKAQGTPEASQRYFTLSEEAGRISEGLNAGGSSAGATKYQQYQLPGGENYREILLTLPVDARATYNKIAKEEFSNAYADLTPSQQTQVQGMARGRAQQNYEGVYQSSHFNEPNILAHMRVNDRVDADGKKMLLIEEIQSDWHQAGRLEGYQNKSGLSQEQIGEKKDEIFNRFDAGEITREQRNAELDSLGVEIEKLHGVPDAPFKDTWHQLALKRALKYAADNGYDRVGLTTGRQQVDRYTNEIRQNVDEIVFEKSAVNFPVKLDTPNIQITASKNGKETFSGSVSRGKFIDGPAQGKTVEEVLGKSMAKQIAEHKQDVGSIKGDDLTIGGEGMKAYYDEIYPAFLAKQGKKYNAKTGETTIGLPPKTSNSWAYFRDWFAENHSNVGGSSTALANWERGANNSYVKEFEKFRKTATQNENIRYIDISPEMRGGVKKGQPLFTAAPIGGIGLGAGTQDNEMPDAVRQYMADPRYSDPFADTTR